MSIKIKYAILLLCCGVALFFLCSKTTETLPASQAFADPDVQDYLNANPDVLESILLQQEDLRQLWYAATADRINQSAGQEDKISAERVEELTNKYNLDLPGENANGLLDRGTLRIRRGLSGKVTRITYQMQ